MSRAFTEMAIIDILWDICKDIHHFNENTSPEEKDYVSYSNLYIDVVDRNVDKIMDLFDKR